MDTLQVAVCAGRRLKCPARRMKRLLSLFSLCLPFYLTPLISSACHSELTPLTIRSLVSFVLTQVCPGRRGARARRESLIAVALSGFSCDRDFDSFVGLKEQLQLAVFERGL